MCLFFNIWALAKDLKSSRMSEDVFFIRLFLLTVMPICKIKKERRVKERSPFQVRHVWTDRVTLLRKKPNLTRWPALIGLVSFCVPLLFLWFFVPQSVFVLSGAGSLCSVGWRALPGAAPASHGALLKPVESVPTDSGIEWFGCPWSMMQLGWNSSSLYSWFCFVFSLLRIFK